MLRSQPKARSSGLLRSAFLRCGFSLEQPLSTKNISERVVPFVARVFVHDFVRCHPRILPSPRLRPRRRILDGEPIKEVVAVGTGKALDDVKTIGRSAEARLRREIRCIDDESIALPMADRVAHPFPDV